MAKILSKEFDKRINTWNYFIEMTYEEYIEISHLIINNNEHQRKRVKSSSSVYSLLREDLKIGCIIPPIVLALPVEMDTQTDNYNDIEIDILMKEDHRFIILDGLQRTYTLIDAYEELRKEENESEFLKRVLRAEVYVGINRFGTLYRMLTLNTGQTPMSLRHQIEILYGDLNLESKSISLFKESENKTPSKLGEYAFKDAVDGFVSYLHGTYLPMNKSTVLETIEGLETISKEDLNNDLFEEFMLCYHKFVTKLSELFPERALADYICGLENGENESYNSSGFDNIKSYLFADSVFSFSIKPQLFTAFGGAIGTLKHRNLIKSISEVSESLDELQSGDEDEKKWFSDMNNYLYSIKTTSKKIGNSQRMYLYWFLRNLFYPEGDSYRDLATSVKFGYDKYEAEY